MSVYIESVALDNFFMTAFICFFAYRILRQRVDYWLLSIVSCIGTLFAILYPLLNIGGVAIVAFKILLGCILGYILFWSSNKKLVGVITFFVTTFLMGGVMFGINYIISGDVTASINQSLVPVPLWAIAIALFVASIMLFRTIDASNRAKDAHSFEREVELFYNNQSVRLSGFVDTGNRVYYLGKPISIINYSKIRPILDVSTRVALSGLGDNSSGRLVEIETINGTNKIFVIKSDKIVLYFGAKTNIFYEMLIGISKNDIAEYDMLLPPYVCA